MLQLHSFHRDYKLRLRCVLLAACSVVLTAGCASKVQQGYGVPAAQSTAALAQAQMQQAERATEVDTAQTYLDLIVQMQKAGQWYASLAHADAFIQQHGSSPSALLLRADALRNTDQMEQAQQLYAELIATPLTAAKAYRGIGLIHAVRGRYADALQALERARQLQPIDGDVLSDMAYAYMLAGDLERARVPALQAAQLAPDNARVQMNLALFWMLSDQQPLAAQLVQKLQEQAPVRERRASAEVMQALQQQAVHMRAAVNAAQLGQPLLSAVAAASNPRAELPMAGIIDVSPDGSLVQSAAAAPVQAVVSVSHPKEQP